MIVVVMGVCGVGKTTIGKLLATELEAQFLEGDDLHPQVNRDKMARGEALTDQDRLPWLNALVNSCKGKAESGNIVVTCSALKASYRKLFREKLDRVDFLHLELPVEELRKRLNAREGHFMPSSLLESQLDALERPKRALNMNIEGMTPQEVVSKALACL